MGTTFLRAALIWNADFESYDTSSGSAALLVNSTGATDTFTSTSSNNLTSVAIDVRAASPTYTNLHGNALYTSGTNTTGAAASASIRVFQSNIASLAAGAGALVVGFDLWNTGVMDTAPNEARTSTGRYGNTINSSSIALSKTYHFTIVINRTGSNITLGDAASTSLATDTVATYWSDGTTTSIAQLGTGGSATGFITGFGIGESLSTLGNNLSLTTWYDNFGVWNSLGDTVNGVSVLSLAPGTIVPEPSTNLLMLAAAFALSLCFRRSWKSRSSQ